MKDGLWIFGYGSIIWRVDFPFVEKRPAYIEHYARRFWQGSTDHRGVPQLPGRVVTLITQPDAICWGMAYRISAETKESVLASLDYREKGGYDRLEIPINLRSNITHQGITYRANEHNPDFLGQATPSEIAHQVTTASGPSGSNIEYVLKLAQALREIEVVDLHVVAIEHEVKRLINAANASR